MPVTLGQDEGQQLVEELQVSGLIEISRLDEGVDLLHQLVHHLVTDDEGEVVETDDNPPELLRRSAVVDMFLEPRNGLD